MPLTSFTRAQLRDNLRSRLGSKASSAPFWTAAELNWNILETLRQWNLLTGYWASRGAVTVPGGTSFLTLPSTITVPGRVTWAGVPLMVSSLFNLDYSNNNWQNEDPSTPAYWCPVGLNLIVLYPSPAITSANLIVDGITQTPVMAGDGSYVDLEQPLFDVLLDYARHLSLFKLGGPEFTKSQEAVEKLFSAAGEFNRRLKASATFREVIGMIQQNQQHPMLAGSKSVSPRV